MRGMGVLRRPARVHFLSTDEFRFHASLTA
jgi:hypothetical protein